MTKENDSKNDGWLESKGRHLKPDELMPLFELRRARQLFRVAPTEDPKRHIMATPPPGSPTQYATRTSAGNSCRTSQPRTAPLSGANEATSLADDAHHPRPDPWHVLLGEVERTIDGSVCTKHASEHATVIAVGLMRHSLPADRDWLAAPR